MPGSQDRPAQADHPAGAGGGAGATAPDEVQALLVEIFARTGQKVQADDPLVAAALIHSALLRRAGEDAAQAIEKAALATRGDLQTSVQQLHQGANALQQALSQIPSRSLTMSAVTLALLSLASSTLGAALALAAQRWIG